MSLHHYVVEPLLGYPIKHFLESGRPLINQHQSAYKMLWTRTTAAMRFSGHWFMGLCEWIDMSEEKHAAFFQRIDKVVPQERRLEVDPRKTTYEELCSFLEIKPCKKSGRLPRAINLGNHEFDFSPAYMLCFPVWVGIHWLNWRFVHWLLPLLFRPVRHRLVPLLSRRARPLWMRFEAKLGRGR
eukprot:UN0039